MIKKLNKKQIELLMWYFKDGVRNSNNLSMGQRETLENIKVYEDMDSDIDRQLEYFKDKGY